MPLQNGGAALSQRAACKTTKINLMDVWGCLMSRKSNKINPPNMKIALIGYGKMGKAVERVALSKGHEIILRIAKNNIEDLTKERLGEADVAIEFSLPSTAFHHISLCIKNNLPVVSGTTGWMDRRSEIEELCMKKNGTFFYASNFSIGVNLLFAVNRYLAGLINKHEQYDVAIEEIHHTQKLDYPSGTALTLAKGIIEKSNLKNSWSGFLDGKDSEDVPNNDSILKITSKRIDQVPGSHFVKWSSAIDYLEISHVAHSREGFAMGALAAAEWVIGKKGILGMEDMLGF